MQASANKQVDSFLSSINQNSAAVALTQNQSSKVQELQENSNNLSVRWNQINTVPTWLRITNLKMNWGSSDYTERVYQFLDEYGTLYKINNPRQELRLQNTKQDALGMTHVTLQQVDRGVSVFGGQLQFSFRADGNISSINGHYFPDQPEIAFEPTVSAQRAQQIAKQAVHDQYGTSEEQLNQSGLKSSEPVLYFYNHGIFSKRNESTYLVWAISVHSIKTLLDQTFYINAHDGSVVNITDNIQTDKDINTLVLADCTDEIGTLTYNETSTSDSDTIGSSSSDAQAWEVNGYTGLVYDYYFDTFGRDSFDDTDPTNSTDGGGMMKSYTHYEVDENDDGICEQFGNAGWNPTDMYMAYGEDYRHHTPKSD